MWVIVIIDAKPNTAIYEVKEKVWKYKSYEPFPSQVKADRKEYGWENIDRSY